MPRRHHHQSSRRQLNHQNSSSTAARFNAEVDNSLNSDRSTNERVLETPVWQEDSEYDSGGSYLPSQDYNDFSPPSSSRHHHQPPQRQQSNRRQQQQASKNRSKRGESDLRNRASTIQVKEIISANEAFRIISSGVEAENEGRYGSAVRFFLDGAEMLERVSHHEKDDHIASLMMQKASEVVQWAENLTTFENSGRQGPVPRRFGRTVNVDLTRTRLAGQLPALLGRTDEEARTMYYTACSSKTVSNFTADGYRLQCNINGRNPRLLVVITMYNEDKSELNNTLRKVANNIKHIQHKELPGYTDDEAWKNILVVIVSDGRTKANKGTLEFLHSIGCFDEAAMNITMTGVDTHCHIFEYSAQFAGSQSGVIGLASGKGAYPPMQILFALKEHNAGKLNSHEWYFNAFAEQIQPDYTVLLDVGTLPTKTAFYRLLSAMEMDEHIGGTCGEIAVDKPIPNLCNWVIAAQHFEYKISNIMDKSLESVFGFISVLPGAFSAYRYKAIRGAPLEAYFKSLTTPMHELGPFQGNMYLAEDRILCFELLARRNQKWTMLYVKDAIARTDVPTDLVSLIGQRRRWLNGSFFALVYTIINWGRVYTESNHSYIRKIFLFLQYAYMTLNVTLSWILPANFFLVTYFLVIIGLENDSWGLIPTKDIKYKSTIIQVFSVFYGVSFLIQLVAGLGNKPKHIKWIYRFTAIFYAFVMLLTTVIAVSFVLKKLGMEEVFGVEKDPNMFAEFSTFDGIAAMCTIGIFFLASAIHCELHHICLSFIQYMCLLPTFVNVLNTYSFCNLHDLSWGTKGLESSEGHGPKAGASGKNYKDAIEAQRAAEEAKKKEATIKDKMEGNFQYFRSQLLILWICCNLSFAYFVIILDGYGTTQAGVFYLTSLFYIVASFNIFRLIGSTLFMIHHYRQKFGIAICLRHNMRKKLKMKQRKQANQYQNHMTPSHPISHV